MPIVEPLLWLAVACLLVAFIGVLRENIRLKYEVKFLNGCYDSQSELLSRIMTETEKASNV